MTDRDAFKLGFLARCVEAGQKPEDMLKEAQTALDLVKNAGVVDALSGLGTKALDLGAGAAKGLLSFGIPAAAMAPPALGAVAGYGAARMSDIGDTDVAEIRSQELIDQYRRESERLRRQKAVKDYHRALNQRQGRRLL